MKSPLEPIEQALWSDRWNVKQFPAYAEKEQFSYVHRLLRYAKLLPFSLATIAIDALFVLPSIPDSMLDPRNQLRHLSPIALQYGEKLSYIQMLTAIQETGLVAMAEQIKTMPKETKGSDADKQRTQTMEKILKQIFLFLSYSTIELPLSAYDEAHEAITKYLQNTLPGESSKLVDTLCIQCAKLLAAIEIKKS